MENHILKNLLKLFYYFSIDYIFYIEKGLLKGFFYKRDIEEKLSDLDEVKSFNNKIDTILNKLQNLETALEIHQSFSFLYEENKVIPIVNSNIEVVGLWGRKEIIQSWENMPQIKKWSPLKISDKEIIKSKDDDSKESQQEESGKKIKITVPHDFKNRKEEIAQEDTKNLIKDNNYWAQLVVLTMETLPVPMLAVNIKGDELFYNAEWENIQNNNQKLKTNILYKLGKEKIGSLALENKLDIKDTFEIMNLDNKSKLLMKTIFNFENKADKNIKAIGYLFWIFENQYSGDKNTKNSIEENMTKKTFKDENKKSYMGQTLPDLLASEEKKILKWAMEESGGNQSNAAMLLGIPRQTFSYRYRKLFNNKNISLIKKINAV
ncbi:MAG: helix-turn-helix domain-containing protein [Spirochaetia bacterium]|nr:helix-turn-helix domain-containing protein [Spirochaetia bacterium]